jgi:malate permease and related proteins
MSIFLHILGYNILPIFILIVLGYVLGKKFELNILTLSKINFYIFIPAFILYNLYTAKLALDMVKVLFCSITIIIANSLVSTIMGKMRKYDPAMTNAFKNSVMFNNCGNIGLSLITLIFSSTPFLVNGDTPYLNTAISVQIIIMVIQNISSNTIGFYNAGRANLSLRDCILKILSMPTIYALPAALLLRLMPYDFTTAPGWAGLEYLKNGLAPFSLITLGIQLGKAKFDFGNKDVYLSVFTRLILGPALAVLMNYVFGFSGIIAQTIMIAYAVPTAVNTALIAVEFNNCEDFASQAVMMSTLLSAVTLTLSIYAARIVYPV